MTLSVADPYADSTASGAGRFLYGLNPLAKIAAPLPAMLLLVLERDLATPIAFLVLAYVLLLAGARLSLRLALLLLVAMPAAIVLIALGMAVWTDPARIDTSTVVWSIGSWNLYGGALMSGLATALRLAAIISLAMLAGLTTNGPDLVRSAVQHLRVPYRAGYTALAAFRFVPRFGHELDIIRQAHRVRGASAGRGPFAAIARWWGYIVPLLAGAIRHAERVALAMDSRAFGAYPDRTERHLVPWRRRDTVFVLTFWAVSAALLTTGLWMP